MCWRRPLLSVRPCSDCRRWTDCAMIDGGDGGGWQHALGQALDAMQMTP